MCSYQANLELASCVCGCFLSSCACTKSAAVPTARRIAFLSSDRPDHRVQYHRDTVGVVDRPSERGSGLLRFVLGMNFKPRLNVPVIFKEGPRIDTNKRLQDYRVVIKTPSRAKKGE